MFRTSKIDELGTYESFEKLRIALSEKCGWKKSRPDQRSRKFFGFSTASGFGKSMSRTLPNLQPEPRAADSALARACAATFS